MNSGKSLTIATVLLFVAQVAYATTIHVPSEQPELASALETAQAGDTVLLAPDVYAGPGFGELICDNPILIMGGGAADETVIQLDGNNFMRIPYFGFAEFRNLTFEGGGTVIHAEAHGSATARNCVFRDNSFGLTEDWWFGTFTFDSCWFEGNSTAIQTTEYETYLTVTNSVFLDNYYAIHAQSYDNDVIGNLFIDNFYGFVCYGYAEGCDCLSTWYGANISNNLFYDGVLPVWGYGSGCENDAFTCNNLFFSGPKDTRIDDLIGINGNISEDPLFCDTSLATFDVYAGSPLLPGNNACSTLIGMAQYGCFVCGDIDGSADEPNIADLICLVSYMFQDGPAPPTLDACNVDGVGTPEPDIADLIHLVTFMFQDGPDLQCP